MARKRIQIITHSCPRCGKTTAGLSRSITGAEGARNKFKGICESCIKPEERKEILNEQAKGIINKIGDK